MSRQFNFLRPLKITKHGTPDFVVTRDFVPEEGQNTIRINRNLDEAAETSTFSAINETTNVFSHKDATASNFGWMIFILIVSSLLTFMTVGYLQDQPLSKQCLLTHLYKDIVRINLLFVFIAFRIRVNHDVTAALFEIHPYFGR